MWALHSKQNPLKGAKNLYDMTTGFHGKLTTNQPFPLLSYYTTISYLNLFN